MKRSDVFSIKEITDLTKHARSTIYFYMKKKNFPQPIGCNNGINYWKKEEILNWIKNFEKKPFKKVINFIEFEEEDCE